jgi:hypothetical protein
VRCLAAGHTDWAIRGSNSVRGKCLLFSPKVSHDNGGPPLGSEGSLRGVKQPGPEADHSVHLVPRVHVVFHIAAVPEWTTPPSTSVFT